MVEEAPSLFEIVGGVAGAVAVVAAALGAARGMHRRYQRWRLKEKLRSHVRELLRLDELLRETTMSMDRLFSEGFPWAGYAIFTGEMGRHLQTLQSVASHTADAVADVRSLDASGPEERLRSDVERLAAGLRSVVPLYIWGIVNSYRGGFPTPEKVRNRAAEEGVVRIPPSATGREATRVLRGEDRARVRDLRLDLRVLCRTVTKRLKLDDEKDEGFALWPIDMAESYQEPSRRSGVTIPFEA